LILHIGGDEFVSQESILMILDAKCLEISSENVSFVENFSKSARKMNPGGVFKSVILTEDRGERRIYYSPISVATLRKRIRG